MLPVIPNWVHVLALPLVLRLSLARGDRLVKLAGLYNFTSCPLGYVASCLVVHFQGDVTRLSMALSVIDVVFYLFLLSKSDHYWTIAAAAVAIVGFATNFAQMMLHTTTWAYVTAQIVWFYACNAAILAGALSRHTGLASPPFGAAAISG